MTTNFTRSIRPKLVVSATSAARSTSERELPWLTAASVPIEQGQITMPAARAEPEAGFATPHYPSPDELRAAAAPSRPAGPAMLRGLELLRDVSMDVTAQIGSTRMTISELLNLSEGAVVELDRAAGAPADLLVNGHLIARGEVVVIDENFALRITEIISDETAPLSS